MKTHVNTCLGAVHVNMLVRTCVSGFFKSSKQREYRSEERRQERVTQL